MTDEPKLLTDEELAQLDEWARQCREKSPPDGVRVARLLAEIRRLRAEVERLKAKTVR